MVLLQVLFEYFYTILEDNDGDEVLIFRIVSHQLTK